MQHSGQRMSQERLAACDQDPCLMKLSTLLLMSTQPSESLLPAPAIESAMQVGRVDLLHCFKQFAGEKGRVCLHGVCGTCLDLYPARVW